MRAFHRRARDIMEKWGGSFVNPSGDGALFVFGFPKGLEDAAERAVLASLALVAAVKTEKFGRAKITLKVRVGIHTGTATLEGESE
jgi:class 3 adenylate cyclase